LLEFEYCICMCVDGLAHTVGIVIHVDFCRRFEVLVTPTDWRVFRRSVGSASLILEMPPVGSDQPPQEPRPNSTVQSHNEAG